MRVEGHWYRQHAERDGPDRGLWWFSSTHPEPAPGGRFDLEEPRGTCYLGATPGVTARERCGPLLDAGAVPAGHLTGRLVTTVALAPTVVADLTHADGGRLGVTAELTTGHDYRMSSRWAAAIDRAPFAGVLYAPRFTPAGGGEHAVAVFGGAGNAAPPGHPVITHRPLADVVRSLGYVVMEPPTAGQLQVDHGSPPAG